MTEWGFQPVSRIQKVYRLIQSKNDVSFGIGSGSGPDGNSINPRPRVRGCRRCAALWTHRTTPASGSPRVPDHMSVLMGAHDLVRAALPLCPAWPARLDIWL